MFEENFISSISFATFDSIKKISWFNFTQSSTLNPTPFPNKLNNFSLIDFHSQLAFYSKSPEKKSNWNLHKCQIKIFFIFPTLQVRLKEISKLRKLQIFILRWQKLIVRIFRLILTNPLVGKKRWKSKSLQWTKNKLSDGNKYFFKKSFRQQVSRLFHSLPTLLSWVVQLPQAKLLANVFIQKIFSQCRKRENWKAPMENLNKDGKKNTRNNPNHDGKKRRGKKSFHVVDSHTMLERKVKTRFFFNSFFFASML